MVEKRLFTVKELADYIGSTKGSIYAFKCEGKIPKECIIKMGKSLRFDVIAIDKWLDSLRCSAV